MSVPSGTRLGPYEIVAPLGAGGMGEVYKARDARLDRDVALKVLPTAAAADPDRLRRFEQEARATAALNHPNILAVFDVGSDAGVNYVVSELLEGETLRDRLKTGTVPPRKAIDYAIQIARGLAAAHEKGIVHRDLKPDNLFLTRDGRLKILDFGIAKLLGPAGGEPTIAPTIDAGTTPGMVLGTVGYMSPEQVRGLPADHRTDIFSFGAVVYEMLAGRRAFAGATHADTMSAILTADPPELADGAHAVPAMLDRFVRRCLEKNPEERFQSARDIAFNLDAISTTTGHGTGGVAAMDSPAAPARLRRAWVAAALALGLTAGAAAAWVAAARMRPAPAPAKFQQLTFRRGTITAARFSPDGDTVVYSSAWEGKAPELYSTHIGAIGERPLGIQGELLAISRTGEMAILVNVTPLSNWMQTGTLARAPLGGGAPRETLRDIGGADWSADGQQLAVTRFLQATRHWRLEYPAGTVIHESDKWIERPRLSPDGSRVALFEHPISGDNRGIVIVVSLKGERTVISPEYSALVGSVWSPSGDEVWFTASTGGNRLELLGARPGGRVRQIAPTPGSVVVEDARADGQVLLQAVSLKARLLVKTPRDAEERDLSWFDNPLLRDMSPDGSLVLFDEEGEGGGPNYSAFVRRTDGSPAVRIGEGYALRLSPDSQSALTSVPSGPANAWTITPIGPGEPRKIIVPLQATNGIPRWFPDGKRLAVIGNEPGRPNRSYEFSIETGKARPLTPEGTTGTLVSPDGRFLIVATTDGRRLVWPVDGSEPREVRGILAADLPAGWSADSGSIFVSAPTSGRGRDIARLDLVSGRRQVVTTFGPSDPAGVRTIGAPLVSADGRTYAYRYSQTLSDLFVGVGLK
jgi:Tol biopolymer transport system component